MKRLDITGERYGKLLAVRRIDGLATSRWKFMCDCGNETEALLGNVRTGQIRSCGCAGSRATIGRRVRKHGHSVGFKKSRTAMAWRNAKTRCFNQNNAKYPAYGGRGVTMCKEWVEDFRAFLRDMGECPEGLTLDRKDVNGNYEPGNCRWATHKQQATNTTKTVYVETASGPMALSTFAETNGVSYKMLHRRVRKLGEAPDTALRWLLAKQIKTRCCPRNNRPCPQS